MNPLLVSKAKEWAALSGGCFPLSVQHDHSGPNVAPYNEEILFKWAKAMSPVQPLLFNFKDQGMFAR